VAGRYEEIFAPDMMAMDPHYHFTYSRTLRGNRMILPVPGRRSVSGSEEDGADSIIVSGGYEDDEDRGDEIIYTGHGGRDPNTGRQAQDQEFARGNRALARSKIAGLPVRVARRSDLDSPYAPPSGHRYDGLYAVDDFWQETGRSGLKVWRYRLRKVDAGALPPRQPETPIEVPPTSRTPATIQRIVRNTQKAREDKELYDFECQVCRARLETPAGPYAEWRTSALLALPTTGRM
jgi:putative restriction endonuclease